MSFDITGALRLLQTRPLLCIDYTVDQLHLVCSHLGLPLSNSKPEMCASIARYLTQNPVSAMNMKKPTVNVVKPYKPGTAAVVAPEVVAPAVAEKVAKKADKPPRVPKPPTPVAAAVPPPPPILGFATPEVIKAAELANREAQAAKERAEAERVEALKRKREEQKQQQDVIEIDDSDDEKERAAKRGKKGEKADKPAAAVAALTARFCQAVQISDKAKQSVPKDVSKLENTNGIKYIKKYLANLPNCSTIVTSTKQSYDMQLQLLKAAIKLQNSGNYIFSKEGDVANEMYIQCFVRDIIACMRDPNVANGNIPFETLLTNDKAKQYIRLKFLDTDNKYGKLAFLSVVDPKDSKYQDNFGVLKFSKVSDNRETMHELAIGFALNNLRQTIPYFAYMYGGFYCSKQSSRNTELECTSKDLVAMNIQQFVPDAKYLDKLALDNQDNHEKMFKMMKDALIQVGYGLLQAQKSYQYMHFDLHDQNVMVRKVPESNITLNLGDQGTITLKNVTVLPTIIDYGKNSMMVDKMFICPKPNDKRKAEVVQELANNKDEFFITGFDIYRYSVNCIVQVYKKLEDKLKKKAESSPLVKDLNRLLRYTMIEFGKNYEKVKTKEFKKLMKQVYDENDKNLCKNWLDGILGSGSMDDKVNFIRVQDADALQINVAKWIKNMSKFEPNYA